MLIGEENEIGDRAYGKDADLTARMSLAMASGLREGGIIPCFKHIPGHGAAVGSTHSGEAISSRTLEEMRQTDWLPFRRAIADGAEMIMISHLTAKELDAKAPSSLSSVIITDYLRGELGFDGVVITDALRMDAITENYNSGPAALAAFQAGADILLLPNNLEKAADAILKAVEAGEIPMERLNESVERILALKIQYGIIR